MIASVVSSINWLQVLAMPHVYRSLGRMPTRELLLKHVDFFIAYVRTGKCFTDPTFPNPPQAEREGHAVQLRVLLEQWNPPELSEEIISTVRRLLYSEGFQPPMGWDKLPAPSEPMTDSLVWS